jgi:hypothetical protein
VCVTKQGWWGSRALTPSLSLSCRFLWPRGARMVWPRSSEDGTSALGFLRWALGQLLGGLLGWGRPGGALGHCGNCPKAIWVQWWKVRTVSHRLQAGKSFKGERQGPRGESDLGQALQGPLTPWTLQMAVKPAGSFYFLSHFLGFL